MATLASHTPATNPSPLEVGSGLEIIEGFDAQLAEQGIVRVENIRLTHSGGAVYEISRALTDGSLDEALKSGTLSTEQATLLTLDALRVVSEMHRMGLDAHGDIRPRNVLVDTKHHTAAIGGFHATALGEEALSSFGVDVSHVSGGDLEGSTDLSFAAPELVLGAEPDQKSDVYEGARTLLFALSGKRPPLTVKYFDDIQGNSLEPVAAPDLSMGFPADTPDTTRYALQQALSPNPDERQSMGQLVEEISGNVYPVPAQQINPQILNN